MKRNSPKIEQFEPAEDIEAALGLPDGFLASKRRQPDGPCFYRLGRRTVRYRRSEVIRWIDACERAPGRDVSAASAGAPA